MSEDDKESRSLEIALTEKVYTRLKNQMLAFYVVSFVFALGIGVSLLWEYRTTSELADARLSEYRLLVTEKLGELHRLDLEEVARATQPVIECKSPLPREDAVALLNLELGRIPKEAQVSQLLEEADGFGVCDIGEIRHILDDTASMARVDTVYRMLLHHPPDPISRFVYGYWLASGVGVEAVARDVMASPEFQKLKKLSPP